MVLFLFQDSCFRNLKALGLNWQDHKVADGGDIGDTRVSVEAKLDCERSTHADDLRRGMCSGMRAGHDVRDHRN
jgi:hypothetical protein